MYKKRCRLDADRAISRSIQSKRGQITIFIIVGLLLILALLLVVAVKQEIVTFKPEEIIPTEKGKVKQFISQCIDDLGSEALTRIGTNGGYIIVPSQIMSDSASHLRISPAHVVPYWLQGNELNIPSLQYIKLEMDLFMEENLRDCVLGQEVFQEQYNIIEKSDIIANTEVVEQKVIFNVRWDLEIQDKAGEVITEIIDHTAESNVKLKRTYETARRIVEEELAQLKFEDITQDLISLEHPNVPVSGIELTCGRKEWNVQEVKEQLQELIRINVGQLKVKGTEFIEFPDTLPYYQNHYVWDVGEGFIQPNVGVVFDVDPRYPFTFQVTPTSNGKMRSGISGGMDILSNICVQTWKFTYDVSYPVLTRVVDETTGYNFNTAFTVHLIRNMPNRGSPIVARNPAMIDFVRDDEYCEQTRIPMTVITSEVVDNPAQGIYFTQPLGDVDISYTCLKYRCDLGKSEFDFESRGYQSGVTMNFPYCVGGILRAEKEGYKEAWQRVTTASGAETEILLTPLFELPASKISIVTHDWVEEDEELGREKALDTDDLVIVRLINYKEGQEFHRTEQVFTKEVGEEAKQQLTFELLAEADFTYTVEIDMFNDNEFIGGYRGNWTIPWHEVENAEQITFHTSSARGASDEEIFTMFAGLPSQSVLIPEPEIATGEYRGEIIDG